MTNQWPLLNSVSSFFYIVYYKNNESRGVAHVGIITVMERNVITSMPLYRQLISHHFTMCLYLCSVLYIAYDHSRVDLDMKIVVRTVIYLLSS